MTATDWVISTMGAAFVVALCVAKEIDEPVAQDERRRRIEAVRSALKELD